MLYETLKQGLVHTTNDGGSSIVFLGGLTQYPVNCERLGNGNWTSQLSYFIGWILLSVKRQNSNYDK